MKQCSKFVGLDTHQDTIAVAVSEASGGAVLWRDCQYAERDGQVGQDVDREGGRGLVLL